MIPAGTNLSAIEHDLQDDGVAIGSLGDTYPEMVDSLAQVVVNARQAGAGELCVVHLEKAPSVDADHRDVAEQILRDTDCTTVILRSPAGGDVVSETFSRKAIEQYQGTVIGTPDYVGSTQAFVDQAMGDTTDWSTINIVLGLVVLLAAVVSFMAGLRQRRATSSHYSGR